MFDPYPIVDVPTGVFEPEEMGSKKKFWYNHPKQPERSWLFKYPRYDTGEHWAEKVAAEVAELLGIPHAKVELAEFEGRRGSVTESFARDGRELIHGNQMLARVVHDYDPAGTFHQSNHTLANIWKVMDRIFVKSESSRRAKFRIAEYLVLDALIGNTDRHHENWGVLRRQFPGGQWRGVVAPSFDHASSLGRELLDERRDVLTTDNRVGDYVERGRGALYWSENERRGPSPLELVRKAVHEYPSLFGSASVKLGKLNRRSIGEIVDRVPMEWMSSSARRFSMALMIYNLEQLQELFR